MGKQADGQTEDANVNIITHTNQNNTITNSILFNTGDCEISNSESVFAR